jgi:hypothetical protein
MTEEIHMDKQLEKCTIFLVNKGMGKLKQDTFQSGYSIF